MLGLSENKIDKLQEILEELVNSSTLFPDNEASKTMDWIRDNTEFTLEEKMYCAYYLAGLLNY